jgi:type VI secretion system protein ImpH
MAAEIGPAATPVSDWNLPVADALFEAGYRFDFFQTVRLFQQLHADRRPIGRYEDPLDEVVRLREHHSLSFPPSQLFEITPPEDDDPDRRDTIWVNFMGLGGVSGPLPRHYAELLATLSRRAAAATFETDIFSDRLSVKQTAGLREFLDIFSHRLISFFYRAWEKYRFPIAYERERVVAREEPGDPAIQSRGRQGTRPGLDTFSKYLYCLIGLGTPGLQGKLQINDQILLFYTGLLAQRPRSAIALEGVLEDYFGVPVEVVQFQGQWFEMNPDLLSSLGAGGQNNVLGQTAVLWQRIWDPQAKFRLNVGPLTYRQFREFLPGAAGYRHMVELTRFYVGEDVNFEIRPVLRREEVPSCELGLDRSVRLGWSMWLKVRPFEEDVPQPVFEARVAAH